MIISVAIITIFIRFRNNDCFFPVKISIAIVRLFQDFRRRISMSI